MKYFVLEIQKSTEGNVATLTTVYDDKEHAEAGTKIHLVKAMVFPVVMYVY